MEAHGGPIRAESPGVGCGTRVTLTVPVAEAAAHGDAATRVRNRSDASRDAQAATPILVVDDDPQMLRYVRAAPAAGGFAPLVAGEPVDLSGFVRTHRPGLVLLDLVLPGVDGIALMEQVAELADLPDGGWHLWDSAYHGPHDRSPPAAGIRGPGKAQIVKT